MSYFNFFNKILHVYLKKAKLVFRLVEIQKNLKTKLNLDLTNPISYVWYGSSKELIRASLIEIQNNYPAAIYVDNKVGSVSGNNITDYVYDL